MKLALMRGVTSSCLASSFGFPFRRRTRIESEAVGWKNKVGLLPTYQNEFAHRAYGMPAASERGWLEKIRHAVKLDELSPFVRRMVVSVVGGIIVLLGIALIFLPGPAFIVIPVGLAVLALEFEWARAWLEKARNFFHRKKATLKARRSR